jgi:2-keto-3-deoxy-L-rhamnonate aldolase RhmA
MGVRINRLRKLLSEKRPLLGTFLTFGSPALVEFCGLAGFDFVHFDGEHDGQSPETCYDLVRATDAVGVASMVRVPINRPEVILAYVETGVDGIVAPHISSKASAAELVAALRYPPRGHRGAGSASRAANYGLTQTPVEYFAAEQHHAVAAALVEDVEGFDNIEEIAAVPGIEIMFLGGGDLAASMGYPGQMEHPAVVDRIKKAIPLIREHRVEVMLPAHTAAGARDGIALGARVITTTNGALMRGAIRAFLTEAKRQ